MQFNHAANCYAAQSEHVGALCTAAHGFSRISEHAAGQHQQVLWGFSGHSVKKSLALHVPTSPLATVLFFCSRAAGSSHGTVSLHSTLKRIQKELSQSQAEHCRQRPAATGSVTTVCAEEAESAGTDQSPADVAATPPAGGDTDGNDDTDTSASTRWVTVLASKLPCMLRHGRLLRCCAKVPWMCIMTLIV